MAQGMRGSVRDNLGKLLRPFEDKWVALSPDYKRVLSSGETLKETEAKLSETKRAKAIYFKVPPAHAYFVPGALCS